MGRENDPDVQNHALRLTLEWGAQFQKPIDDRLIEKFPDVTPLVAKVLGVLGRKIRDTAYLRIEEVFNGRTTWTAVREELLVKWPWIDDENLSHLHSQGMYYASHG